MTSNQIQYWISEEEFGILAIPCHKCHRKILITRLTAHIQLNHPEQ